MTRTDTHTPSDLVVHATNPLLTLRTLMGDTQGAFASRLKTSKTTIQYAEKGCFNSPPIPYRRHLTRQDHIKYATFRTVKRTTNFHSNHFQRDCSPTSCRGLNFDPESWTKITNLTQLFSHLGLTAFQFADCMCLMPAELFRYMEKIRKYVPVNLIAAFQEVGAPPEFFANFHWSTPKSTEVPVND